MAQPPAGAYVLQQPAPRHAPGALLYVVTDADFAYVAPYPSGGSVQRLTFAQNSTGTGICSDAGGHVFITAEYDNPWEGYVYEFAHGGTEPIATLSDSSYTPSGCGVDSNTEDVAVTNYSNGNCDGGGNVAVYPGAQGPPTAYTISGFFCYAAAAYDDRGDLFVGGMGTGTGYPFVLAELPEGSSQFVAINLSERIDCRLFNGACTNRIQWDGKDLAIVKPTAGHASPSVYRVAISGSTGTVVGTTTFKGDFGKFSGTGLWIDKNKIVLTYRPDNVAIWPYPAGGKSLAIIGGINGFTHPGLVVSR